MRRSRGSKPEHASKYEDRIIANLEARGIKYEYEPQSFEYFRPVRGGRCTLCEGKNCIVRRSYTPDIHLVLSGVWVEAKGKFTGENRSKMEDFLKGNPGFDLRFIFQRDNWITGKHKSKYSDWCKKLKIPFVIGEVIPDEWVIPVQAG